MNTMFSERDAFERFTEILTNAGIRPALAFLLSLTDYRFIAIFVFDDDNVETIAFYDRENPHAENSEVVPIDSTYCCYVRDSRGIFTTANALQDARTIGHPKRQVLTAYCGVPILDSEGVILGTLCHYDVVPRDAEQINLPLMLSVAVELSKGNHIQFVTTQRVEHS
jgi:GAF domain-containing protein